MANIPHPEALTWEHVLTKQKQLNQCRSQQPGVAALGSAWDHLTEVENTRQAS